MVLIGCFDFTLEKQLPKFVYVACAFLMFLGQTFDAIDGKHARNTKRSSSLGQLMDHGCDAMSNYILVIIICQSHCLGSSFYTLLLQIMIQTGFYVFTVDEHDSGVLHTNFNNIGVTEYQFLAMAVVVTPGFVGQFFSQTKLLGFSLVEITVLAVVVSSAVFLFNFMVNSTKNSKDAWKLWKPLINYIFFVIAQMLTIKMAMYQTMPFFIVVLGGFYFGFLASKLIINNTASREIEMFDLDVLVFCCGIVLSVISHNILYEKIICGLIFLWGIIRYYKYVVGTIID